jgi:hypothetical protein
VAGGKEGMREPGDFAPHKSSPVNQVNLVNVVKILIPRVCTGFGGKEEFRMGEKEFVWGSKQARQTTCAELKRVTGISWLQLRSTLDQLRVKAALSANMVELFKKNSALSQVDVN